MVTSKGELLLTNMRSKCLPPTSSLLDVVADHFQRHRASAAPDGRLTDATDPDATGGNDEVSR